MGAFKLEVEKLEVKISETKDQINELQLNKRMLERMNKTVENEIEDDRLVEIHEATRENKAEVKTRNDR